MSQAPPREAGGAAEGLGAEAGAGPRLPGVGQESGGRLEGAEGGWGALPRLGWGRGTDLRIEDAPPPVQMRG